VLCTKKKKKEKIECLAWKRVKRDYLHFFVYFIYFQIKKRGSKSLYHILCPPFVNYSILSLPAVIEKVNQSKVIIG
jgi:hypothetical protein